MQTAITAIRLQPALVPLKPFLQQVQDTVSMTTQKTTEFARQKGILMRQAALLPVYHAFYNVASNLIPDDAYDWEGDLFEEDHIPCVFPTENKGF